MDMAFCRCWTQIRGEAVEAVGQIRGSTKHAAEVLEGNHGVCSQGLIHHFLQIFLKKVEVVLLERPIGLLILITGTSLQDAIHSIFCTVVREGFGGNQWLQVYQTHRFPKHLPNAKAHVPWQAGTHQHIAAFGNLQDILHARQHQLTDHLGHDTYKLDAWIFVVLAISRLSRVRVEISSTEREGMQGHQLRLCRRKVVLRLHVEIHHMPGGRQGIR
mmetsp:Transcript_75818/g.153590  ORF Transcript_75818/g.153590 Transcript_75818/m.153590 type:complete len:216 (+) Transcript_75818:626-1273(+)